MGVGRLNFVADQLPDWTVLRQDCMGFSTLSKEARKGVALYAALIAVTFAAYSPVLRNGFLRYDDSSYVTYNPHVTSGLSWANLTWAFTTGYASNWHPLTWVSHMVDVQLFGLRPGWHHAVNLLLHGLNTLLLGTFLQRSTGMRWPSLLVAALFALHPLHVESVAWIAERKDLLTTLFFLLTLQLYQYYASKTQPCCGRRSSWYLASLACFALALMSKPMAVTLPFVLFLIDFWPLGRWQSGSEVASPPPLKQILLEKVPFFCLAAAAAAVTVRVQTAGQAVASDLSWLNRLSNGLHSYAAYLGKMIWPVELAIFYPHPNIGGAVNGTGLDGFAWLVLVLLLLVSVVAVVFARRLPWLPVGWFWYLGTLVPVLGLVQAGGQAMADRYTYIPLIGIFICVCWGAMRTPLVVHPLRWGLPVGGVLLACAVLTFRQVSTWKDNLTVFQHALRVTRHNAVAHNQIGIELAETGQLEEALVHFRAAFEADPSSAEARFGQGFVLEKQSRPAEAIAEYNAALRLKPAYWLARIRLAGVYWDSGDRANALEQYRLALAQNPAHSLGQLRVGIAAQERGDLQAAAKAFAETVRLDPGDGEALQRLGASLVQLGKLPEATKVYAQLVAAFPKVAEARINYAGALWRLGNREAAILQYAEAVRYDPGNALAQSVYGFALASTGRLEEAGRAYSEAVRLEPGNADVLCGLGRVRLRQGNASEAARLFQEALKVRPDAQGLAGFEAACAELGRFPEAIKAAQELRQMALTAGDQNAVTAVEARISAYQKGEPYREPASAK